MSRFHPLALFSKEGGPAGPGDLFLSAVFVGCFCRLFSSAALVGGHPDFRNRLLHFTYIISESTENSLAENMVTVKRVSGKLAF